MLDIKRNSFSTAPSALKKGTVSMLCIVAVVLFVAHGCKSDKIDELKQEEVQICEFENPLTDLQWLKAKIDEIVLITQNENPLSVSIYQCIYGDGETGFLVDEGNTKPFYNCNGEVLCIMSGFVGETCSELNIVSQELIWEINN